MESERKTKDLQLGVENKNPLPTESINTQPINEAKETSFYSKRKPQKQNWFSKKWGKIAIISTSVVAIGLSLGLGLYYGLMPHVNDNVTIPGYDWDEIKDWVEAEVGKSDVKKQIQVLESESVLFEFDKYANAGLIQRASQIKDNATKQAEKDVQKEKDDYKSTNGSNWYVEWVKFLVTNGYDSEQEYINSKIASALESSVTNLFTLEGNLFTYVTAAQIVARDYKYYSTEPIATGGGASASYIAIKNGTEPESEKPVDIEQYMTFYLQTQVPITASDILIPFTFLGGRQDGLSPNAISIGDLNTLSNLFYRVRQMILSLGIQTTDYLYNFNDVAGGTDGLKNLATASFATTPLTNSILNTLYFGANQATGQAGLNSNKSFQDSFDFLYAINDSIANTVFNQHPNGETGNWPGYGRAGGNITSPANQAAKIASLNAVSSNDFGLKLLEQDVSAVGNYLYQGLNSSTTPTPGDANSKPWVTSIGGATIDYATGLVTFAPNRTTSMTLQLNTLDGFTGTFNPTVGNDNLLLTIGNDGYHITKIEMVLPAEILSGIDTSGSLSNMFYVKTGNDWILTTTGTTFNEGFAGIGERMLISDLNKKANNVYAPFVPQYGIVNGYLNQFGSNYRRLALENTLDDDQFLEDHGMSTSSTDVEEHKKYVSVVNSFYNTFYQSSVQGYLTSYDDFESFYKKYSNIYVMPNIVYFNLLADTLNEVKFWIHDYRNDYQYNTIDWFIENGGAI